MANSNSRGIEMIRNIRIKAIATAAVALLWSATVALAGSPSFDCLKASGWAEKKICSDADLTELDRNLNRIYREALEKTSDREGLKKDQRAWLKSRNKCQDAECLRSRYLSQTGMLQQLVSAQPAVATGPDITGDSAKHTPTYPDVWGMELPVPPEAVIGERIWGLYEDGRGDLIIAYSFDFKDTSYKVRLLSIFSGEIIHEIPYLPYKQQPKEDRRFEDYISQAGLLKLNQIHGIPIEGLALKDGGRLKDKSLGSGAKCALFIGHAIMKEDKNGHELFHKTIVQVHPKPRRFSNNPECSNMDGENEAWLHSWSISSFSFWALDDGTYLIQDDRSPTLIRLKSDFTSPYVEQSNNLLILDADTVFNKLDEVEAAVYREGTKKFGYWVPGQIKGCRIPVECVDLRMTEYFQKLIHEKGRGE